MENVVVVVASFANEADLARFCFYIDFETRPDFEDEVPEHEQPLFALCEELSMPYEKISQGLQIQYGFLNMPEPNEQLAAMGALATALNAKAFACTWRDEYDVGAGILKAGAYEPVAGEPTDNQDKNIAKRLKKQSLDEVAAYLIEQQLKNS